jgi:6-phosphogluconolactonase
MSRAQYFGFSLASLSIALLAGCGGSGTSGSQARTIYVMTNEASGNRIATFKLDSGGIRMIGLTNSGGNGTGNVKAPNANTSDDVDPLGTQGSLVLSPDKSLLFAVNAGSGSVSSFQVAADGTLSPIDTQSTDGTFPASIAVSKDRIYVANINDPQGGGGGATIVGFDVGSDGHLSAIAGSKTEFPITNSRPREIGFSTDQKNLIVSDGTLYLYPIHADGTLEIPISGYPQSISTVAFATKGTTLVAIGGQTSPTNRRGILYSVGSTTLTKKGESLTDGASWVQRVAISPNGKAAFTTSSEGGLIHAYSISKGGLTAIPDAVDSSAMDFKISDLAFTPDGKYVFSIAHNGTNRLMVTSVINNAPSASSLFTGYSLPAGSQGIAVR